jgi:DNA polymerase elongation subunit (family B)
MQTHKLLELNKIIEERIGSLREEVEIGTNVKLNQLYISIDYENALTYITQSIHKLMNEEIQITDLVISKLLRQNIEKYRSLFPHVAAAIRLNISGVISGKGDNIQYVYTDSNHANSLQRITPAKLISSEEYDKEKYLEMLLDSAEAVLSVFGSPLALDLKKKKVS